MTAPGAAGSIWAANVWGANVWGVDVWGDAGSALSLTGPFGAIFVDPSRMATLTEPARQGIFLDPARGATHKRG